MFSLAEDFDGFEDGGDVVFLVFTGEFGGVATDVVDDVMLVGKGNRCVTFGGDTEEEGCCFGLGLAYHHWHALLDDTGFLAGYLLKCVAEELCVVKADIGDDGEDDASGVSVKC